MKKLFLTIVFAAAAISCSSNTFTVKGTITPTDDVKDALVILRNEMANEAIDTAVVVNGKFSFKGEVDPTCIASVSLVTGAPNIHHAMFVPEAGTITIDLDSTDCVKAGPMTEKLHAFIGEMRSAESEEAAYAAMDAAFADNKDNVIGMLALSQKLYEFESQAELDEYIADAADFIKNDERVQKIRTALEALEQTAAGKQYKEIEGTDAAGNPLALSSFIGKGKYVLIDFWASWCGPCRREIPFLIDINKDYAKKGVQVVGINVWDQEQAALRAVEQLGIKYPVIYVKDSSATDDYGVSGIPQILLIAPDGTILERNLRGTGIAASIDKYVK